jgi:hypothetical protein
VLGLPETGCGCFSVFKHEINRNGINTNKKWVLFILLIYEIKPKFR